MKNKLIALFAALLLIPALALTEGPLLLVELPEDAQMVEDVRFEDGDFTQTYLLDSGALVQLLRYGALDMTLDELIEADWTDHTALETLALSQVSDYPAEGARLSWGENAEAVEVTLVLVHVDGQTLIFQIILPQGAQDEDIQTMLDSLGVLGGEIDDEAVVG